MKKIIHIIPGLGTGGAEMMLYKLLSEKSDFDQSVICLGTNIDTTIARSIQAKGVTIIALGMTKRSLSLHPLFELNKIIKKNAPDIIHGWMYHGNLSAILVKLFRPKVKVIWNVRHSLHDIAKESVFIKCSIRLNKLMSFLPDMIIYNSKTSASQHQLFGFCSKKVRVIPNGFDVRLFSPNLQNKMAMRKELGIAKDDIVIGIVARYHAMKGHNISIYAASKLHETINNFRLVLIGKGLDLDNKELLGLIEQYEVTDKVLLLGEKSNLYKYTQMFDIGVSASLWGEGFSNAIGESMACGVPCVVTDVGDSAWIVGGNGEVVPPNNTDAMVGAWQKMIDMDSVEREQLGGEARERMLNNFSIASISEEYLGLYDTLLTDT